jgi:hypothetical protein
MDYWKLLFSDGYRNADGEPAIRSGDESLIVSILSLGTFLGALTAAPTADFFGRRMGLILSTAIVFNLGVIMQTAATSQPLFIAGRFFAGYGVGLISAMGEDTSFRPKKEQPELTTRNQSLYISQRVHRKSPRMLVTRATPPPLYPCLDELTD